MNLYLETLGFTANIVAPIFFIVLLGYVFRRFKLIDDAFVSSVAKLVFVTTFPTLVFLSIARMDFHAMFNPSQLIFITVSILIFYVLIWQIATRWIKDPADLGVFVQGAFRSNYGIIGLAVSFNIFGAPGLAQASLMLALVIPLYNTLSIIALSLPMRSERSISLGGVLLEVCKNPLIIAVVLALPFSYFNIQLPQLFVKTGELFSSLTLPLALLTIGATLNLQSLKYSSALAFWATSLKLVVLPVLLTFIAWLLGFSGQNLVMLFVLFACPTAAVSFVMTKAIGGNAQLAANIILTTTLGSVFTLSAGIFVLKITGVIPV